LARSRRYGLFALLLLASSGWAAPAEERATRLEPSVLELSRQVYDRVRPALGPSRWERAVAGCDRRAGRDFVRLVEPSRAALDTFFHDAEPVPRDKRLVVVVRDRQLVLDFVSGEEAPAPSILPERAPGLRVQLPSDARLLPPETEGLLELPHEVSQVALLVSRVAAVLEARALEFVVSFRSLLGLRYSPQALERVPIVNGRYRVTLPAGTPLVPAYKDREEDDDEDPKVFKRIILRSGVKILLGFCLGLLFWGVVRNL
jgi:hypothetical protein